MTETTTLHGLDGINPLGYLAALGALLVADRMIGGIRLSWTSGIETLPVLHGTCLSDLVDAVMADRDHWNNSPALGHLDGATVDDVKFSTSSEVRRYLQACAAANDGDRSLALAQALVCEFAVDGAGNAKPTDLHFTAGQQRWLRMARELRGGVNGDDVNRALNGPWTRPSSLPSFMWDVSDDRVYALSGRDPAGEKKMTEPGAEWLALQGLAVYGIQRSRPERVAVPGAGGTWKRGHWTWPIWEPPVTPSAAAAFVNRAGLVGSRLDNDARLREVGVTKILSATTLRSEQGGYGSFRPAVVVWERT